MLRGFVYAAKFLLYKTHNSNCLLPVIPLFMFWKGMIHTSGRLSPLTPLLPCQYTHTCTFVTTCIVASWLESILKHLVLYSIYSLTPLRSAVGIVCPHLTAQRQLKQPLIIILLSVFHLFPKIPGHLFMIAGVHKSEPFETGQQRFPCWILSQK